jgi:hypothetical protein
MILKFCQPGPVNQDMPTLKQSKRKSALSPPYLKLFALEFLRIIPIAMATAFKLIAVFVHQLPYGFIIIHRP